MHIRNLVLMFCIVSLLLINACSGKSSTESKALAKYSKETLVPGIGLGDLQLGKTTLDWFLTNIGTGHTSFVINDESAIELSYLNNEAAFLFILSKKCQDDSGGLGVARAKILRDIKAFLAEYPNCKEITLSSISMAAGSTKEDTFFQGSTAPLGIRLFDPIKNPEVPIGGAGNFVAGESLTENLERVEFPNGLYCYYPINAGATSSEIQSGKPLSSERLKETETSNTQFTRFTIFMPDRIETYR